MSETLSLTSGVAGRYATALFSLFKEEEQLKLLQKDIEKISELHAKSEDFRRLISSPIYKREEQVRALGALGKKLNLQKKSENLLQVMASKGRIYLVLQLVRDVTALLENERNEIRVEVISAESISNDQKDKLEKTFSKILDQKARMNLSWDKSLIGGMIVKIGSRMIDTTIKSKLTKLQNIMKEVT
jgi:F-type H+-transporting ATPase subunit delta